MHEREAAVPVSCGPGEGTTVEGPPPQGLGGALRAIGSEYGMELLGPPLAVSDPL